MDGKKIALIGHARSGKDFIGNYLGIWYGHTRLAFADPMKKIAQDLFPDEFKSGKPRELLQWFGETVRTRDPDVWIKHLLRRVEILEGMNYDRFVITDLRLPNEHTALIDAGFTIIKVQASEEVRMKRMEAAGDVFNSQDLQHSTESYVDKLDVDYVIENNDNSWSVPQLDDIMEELGIKKGAA